MYCHAHVPKVEKHKLDSKSRKCVLLGYGDNCKVYQLYDLECRKVIYSREVLFNETSMAGIQNEEDISAKYMELEIQKKPSSEENYTSNPLDNSSAKLIPSNTESICTDLHKSNKSLTGTASTTVQIQQWFLQNNSKTFHLLLKPSPVLTMSNMKRKRL